MSLDFGLTKIKNWESLVYNDDEGKPASWRPRPVTEQIIFGCMAIGMGTITEKNYSEWYARYSLWSKLNNITPLPIGVVKEHIGLTTNVALETRAGWGKRTVQRYLDDRLKDEQWNRVS